MLTLFSRTIAICLLIAVSVHAQQFTFSDNFDSASVGDYFLVDSIGQLIESDFAQFIPTNGAMRVIAPTTPDALLGPARAGFEFLGQPERFSDFEISVDLVDWDDSLSSGFLITARTNGVGGIATLDMYGLGLITNSTGPGMPEVGDAFIINRLDDETPTTLVLESIDLDPEKQYRLLFSGVGANLNGSLFDLADLSTPLATISAVDDTYPSGGNGLAVSAAGLDPAEWTLPSASADATFDNYSITATVPEPNSLPFVVVGLAGLLIAMRQSRSSMA